MFLYSWWYAKWARGDQVAPGVSLILGVVLEAILTFSLVHPVYNTAVSEKAGKFAPTAIGLTYAFSILMGSDYGSISKPSRTLGLYVVIGNYQDIWVYFANPTLGGILAASLNMGILKSDNDNNK